MSLANESINYRSLLVELSNNEHFNSFMELLCKYTDDPYSYTSSPLYRYCLRLFEPRDYCHPTFDNCDEQCWQMFLQLLFANREAQCSFVTTEGAAPELVFSYLSLTDVAASTLSVEEFRLLLLCLLTDAFASTLPYTLGGKVDKEYFGQITDYQSLSRDNIARLYGCTEHSSTELVEFVDWLSSRLAEYSFQTK